MTVEETPVGNATERNGIKTAGAVLQAQESGRYTGKYEGFFFLSNLQGLCRRCHGLKTEEDKTHVGAWPDAVAIEYASTTKKVFSF